MAPPPLIVPTENHSASMVCKSSGSSLTGVSGLDFNVCSTRNIAIFDNGNVKRRLPRIAITVVLAATNQSLARTTKMRLSEKIELSNYSNDSRTRHSLIQSVLIALLETLFEFASNSHKVRTIITNDS